MSADARVFRATSLAIVATCITSTAAVARDLSIHDAGKTFARAAISIRAESIVHRGERLLLLRLGANGARAVVRDDDRVDWVALDDKRHAFLPTTVDCAGVRVESGGKSLAPTLVSPCTTTGRLDNTGAMPVFVALPWPNGTSASIRVPVTVRAPGPPVRRSLHERSTMVPSYDASLIGSRTLQASVLVAEPQAASRGPLARIP